MTWKVSQVQSMLPPRAGQAYGFNITNDWGKPLVAFSYETQD